MAFKVRCPKCQKVYAAETKWIGKRIRCKDCGEGFIVDEPTEELGVQQVAPRTESSSGRSATRMAPPPAKSPQVPDDPFTLRDEEYPTLRASVPQDFPMSTVVEAWLPLALGLIAAVLCVAQIFSQNETGRTWIALLRMLIVGVLYFALIVPITNKTITTTFQKLRRFLPPNPLSRVAATFALPAAFAVVFWQGIGGIGGIATGLLIGLVLMAAVFWLLFRLTPQEAANAYAWASGMFLGSTLVAALILIGISAAVNRVMIEAHATAFRESPLGAQLAWTTPEPAPIKKLADPAPQISDNAVASVANSASTKKPTPKPAPLVKEAPSDPAPTPGTTPGTAAAVSESVPASSPPVAAVTNVAATPPAPDSAPLFANPEDDQFVVNLRKKSVPWIKQVSRANSQGPFDFIVSSFSTAPYLGMVTLDPNAVALRKFSVGSINDTGMRRTSTVEISDGAGTPRSFSRDYFLTPDGNGLLHVQGSEIQIIHMGQKERDTFPLVTPIRQTTGTVTPQIVGLARDQTVVVRWSGASSSEQFVQRYSYATRKPLEAGGMFNCSIANDVTAVSSNSEGPIWFASVITQPGKRPSLALYNASAANGIGGKNTPLPSEVSDLTHYDAELAFAPNAGKIVLMLADSDHTIIYEWVTASLLSPSLHLSLPPLPPTVTTGHVVGPRVRWINDLVFIVDGQTVVGTYPNRSGILGKASDTPVLATASTTKDHILVTYAAEDGFCHASEIEFDPAALKTAMPIKEPPAAH